MADDQRKKSEQSPYASASTGWAVLATLISGMVVWGFIGWLLDAWLDTRFIFPIGIVAGALISIFLVVKRFANLADEDPLRDKQREPPNNEVSPKNDPSDDR